jgi:hypothetical protein
MTILKGPRDGTNAPRSPLLKSKGWAWARALAQTSFIPGIKHWGFRRHTEKTQLRY